MDSVWYFVVNGVCIVVGFLVSRPILNRISRTKNGKRTKDPQVPVAPKKSIIKPLLLKNPLATVLFFYFFAEVFLNADGYIWENMIVLLIVLSPLIFLGLCGYGGWQLILVMQRGLNKYVRSDEVLHR